MTLARTTKRRRTRKRAQDRKAHPPKAGRYIASPWMFEEAIAALENNLKVMKIFDRR